MTLRVARAARGRAWRVFRAGCLRALSSHPDTEAAEAHALAIAAEGETVWVYDEQGRIARRVVKRKKEKD